MKRACFVWHSLWRTPLVHDILGGIWGIGLPPIGVSLVLELCSDAFHIIQRFRIGGIFHFFLAYPPQHTPEKRRDAGAAKSPTLVRQQARDCCGLKTL